MTATRPGRSGDEERPHWQPAGWPGVGHRRVGGGCRRRGDVPPDRHAPRSRGAHRRGPGLRAATPPRRLPEPAAARGGGGVEGVRTRTRCRRTPRAPRAVALARGGGDRRQPPPGHARRGGRRRGRGGPRVPARGDARRDHPRGLRRSGVRPARVAPPVRAPAAVAAGAPGPRHGRRRPGQRRHRQEAVPRREHGQGSPVLGVLEARDSLAPRSERAGARPGGAPWDRPAGGATHPAGHRQRRAAMMLYQLEGAPDAAERRHRREDSRAAEPAPLLSVIVPTRDEEANVAPLLQLLEDVAPEVPAEIIFVDDSDDGTANAVAEAGARCRRDVGLIHRPRERRADGLGGAVVEGLWAARGTWACVMDGDLQHPPQLIADLLAEAERTGADLVVASRRAPHGDADALSAPRALVSRTFTGLARRLFAGRLDGVSDPMSGFFLVRRAALDLETLRPHGFKVLLEILVRTPGLRVAEVPFHFGERTAGNSKATPREGMRFLRLLWRLRIGDMVARFARFGVVGLTGLLVNTLALVALTEGVGFYYLLSAVVASQLSTLWNFFLTDLWVFRGRPKGRTRVARLALFAVMNNLALLLRSPILVLLTSAIGVNYLVSNLLSLALLTVLRYSVADVWIWARDPLGRDAQD